MDACGTHARMLYSLLLFYRIRVKTDLKTILTPRLVGWSRGFLLLHLVPICYVLIDSDDSSTVMTHTKSELVELKKKPKNAKNWFFDLFCGVGCYPRLINIYKKWKLILNFNLHCRLRCGRRFARRSIGWSWCHMFGLCNSRGFLGLSKAFEWGNLHSMRPKVVCLTVACTLRLDQIRPNFCPDWDWLFRLVFSTLPQISYHTHKCGAHKTHADPDTR